MKIISVVGARPNFMKIAPFIRAIEKHNALVQQRKPVRPDLWDGKTAERCLEAIIKVT